MRLSGCTQASRTSAHSWREQRSRCAAVDSSTGVCRSGRPRKNSNTRACVARCRPCNRAEPSRAASRARGPPPGRVGAGRLGGRRAEEVQLLVCPAAVGTKIFFLLGDLSGRIEWSLFRTRGWSREVHSNTNEGSLMPSTYTIRRHRKRVTWTLGL
jgi:hypothetical protein